MHKNVFSCERGACYGFLFSRLRPLFESCRKTWDTRINSCVSSHCDMTEQCCFECFIISAEGKEESNFFSFSLF